MKRIIYLLLISLFVVSCTGRQQGKATNKATTDSISLLEEQYSKVSDPLEKVVLLDKIAKAKVQTLTKDEFGEYFLGFKTQLDSLIAEINTNETDYLYNRYGLHHDKNGNEITPPEWVQEKEKRYADAGLYPTHIGEGFMEFLLADDYFSKNFGNFLPQDVKDYLKLEEKDGKIVSDGGLLIEFSELADEILPYESFIANYPNSKFIDKVKEYYQSYQFFYLNGIDNSPIKDRHGNLFSENRAEFQRFIKAYPDSPTAELVKDVLSNKDQKKFLGTWKAKSDNPHTAFTIDFSANKDDEISASYYDGGPFEVYFTCRFIASNRVDLYFDYIAGSIVFNEITDANAMNQDKNNKVKVIECEWINETEIRVTNLDKERRFSVCEANNLSLFKVE